MESTFTISGGKNINLHKVFRTKNFSKRGTNPLVPVLANVIPGVEKKTRQWYNGAVVSLALGVQLVGGINPEEILFPRGFEEKNTPRNECVQPK